MSCTEIKGRMADGFELLASIGGGQVARLLIGGFTPVASVVAGPIIFIIDQLAQALFSAILGLRCVSRCINLGLQQKMNNTRFIFAKPITFAVTLLAFMALSTLFGVTYPLVNLIAAVVILITGLFATQVTHKVIESLSRQCCAN